MGSLSELFRNDEGDLVDGNGNRVADFPAKDTPHTPKLKLFRLGDLMKSAKPLTWLISKHLQPESTILLFGPPGSWKSLLALEWAISISIGKSWRGHKVAQGPVIYLAGEGHFGINRRAIAWAQENDAADALEKAPFHITERGSMLNTPEGLSETLEAVDVIQQAEGSPVLIVVDTLHRSMTGDENQSKDMGAYFSNLDILRSRYQCAILTVHHSGHNETHRARGSSSIKGAVDTEFSISPRMPGVNALTCTKSKDAPRPTPKYWELKIVELPLIDSDGEHETSVVLVQADHNENRGPSKPMSASMIHALESFFEASRELGSYKDVPLALWREKFMSSHVGETSAAKKTAFSRQRKELVEKTILSVKDDYYTLPTITNATTDILGLAEFCLNRTGEIDPDPFKIEF